MCASRDPEIRFAIIFGRTKLKKEDYLPDADCSVRIEQLGRTYRSFNFGFALAVLRISLSCFTAPSFSRSSASSVLKARG